MQDVIWKTRKQFEMGEIDYYLLKKLYEKYNPRLKNVDLFLERSKILFPKLNCGLTSIYLQHILDGGYVVNGKYKNNNHTFLVFNENIIDITSDQYDGSKIYIGPAIFPWSLDN